MAVDITEKLAPSSQNNEKAFEKIYMISDLIPKLNDFNDGSPSGFNDKYIEISALIDVIGEIKYCGESQNMSKEELLIRIKKMKNNIITNGI